MLIRTASVAVRRGHLRHRLLDLVSEGLRRSGGLPPAGLAAGCVPVFARRKDVVARVVGPQPGVSQDKHGDHKQDQEAGQNAGSYTGSVRHVEIVSVEVTPTVIELVQ